MLTRQSVRINIALISLLLIPLLVSAQGATGGNRLDSGQCPDNAEDVLVYSPFKPYFHWPFFRGTKQRCWVAADCLLEAAGESRKQQFAATALVMGLIPLTLKDIAWPERRLIHVTKRLNWVVEILVLALGLVPLETGDARETRRRSRENNMLAKKAWAMNRGSIIMVILACWVGVCASYAGMTTMEIYSKRSALGCTYPATVGSWYVAGLLPATIHALFAAMRRSRHERRLKQIHLAKSDPLLTKDMAQVRAEEKKIVSAVPGADEDWPVQMAWGVYYIAGTLVFTSIMAVTVVELVCWVGLGFAVTGSSKILAFFLCLVSEKTGNLAVDVD
ncbi:hypothetical protein P171DRAFT_434971 [Karstenula rhodostoma CBS 690.94]|uniref:Uncharacterized protein n=1 Tax=Karstenula rhodostoma CBS 690.94 TaxID=1392251 RepID=A0A9P4U8V5_9PLEO|nr:hypothetical protein P171DRAFT_434971 [Karstenula rhodostoma CBS 690.94]